MVDGEPSKPPDPGGMGEDDEMDRDSAQERRDATESILGNEQIKLARVRQYELTAIKMALQLAAENPTEHDRICILSDSLSSIMSIKNYNKGNGCFPLHHEIAVLVDGLGHMEKSVSICWVPSHVGVTGNDMADAAARRGVCAPVVQEEMSRTEDWFATARWECIAQWRMAWHSGELGSPVVPIVSSANCGVMSELRKKRVLLKTARILVYDVHNKPHVCRAVIDEGAQGDFISERMCGILGLKRHPIDEVVSGLEYQQSSPRFAVEATIASRYTMKPYSLWCRVVDRVSVELPNWPVQEKEIAIPPEYELADPLWSKTERIDILIGGYILNDVLHDKSHQLGQGLPSLKKSEFGWMLFGCWDQDPKNTSTPPLSSHNIACNLSTLASIDRVMKRFWELEEISAESVKSEEHVMVENLYLTTTKRTAEGRYEVQLPLKENHQELGNSRIKALQLLRAVERKLLAQPKLYEEYGQIFQEYLKLGFIEEVPSEEIDRPAYYAPHHCVVRMQATSTKVRIVFNFSSKTTSGLSLNDVLLVGPVVQPDLVTILWRFRRYAIALSCDIVKMYLQTQIEPSQRDLQRFLWNEGPDKSVKDYRFRSVCFGNGASPYLATRSLNQLAQDEGEHFPVAAKAVLNHFYIDDCLMSAASTQEIVETQRLLVTMFQKAKLELSKWKSNSAEVLRELNSELDSCENIHLSGEEVKTLGLSWNPSSDSFCFHVSPDISKQVVTKRTIMSVLARIFDPLGLIGPVVVHAKIMLQRVWRSKVDWDVEIEGSMLSDWKKFVNDLPKVQQIQIPRWAATIQFGPKEELHAFCDASKMAYGAAIYLIVEDEDGKRSSHLLTAKSKVAPIDEITIPKLELCAATLVAILMTRVRTAFGIQPEQCFYWSDAMAVLGQIHSKSTRQEVFVRHRVKTIKDNTIVSQWRYMPTHVNPADILSRGTTPLKLAESDVWWSGPSWLIEDESSWPEPYLYPGQTEEVIAMTVAADPPQPKNVEGEHKLFEKILASASDWNHAKKLTACAIRESWQESVDETQKDFPEFSPTELREAENWLIRGDQQMHLGEALKALKASRLHIKRGFQFLQRLKPFIDATGVMRVGGRLQESEEDLESIHPRIIPKGRLAELIARHEHVAQLHAGPQLLLSSLRRRLWPLGGRYLARKVVHYCDVCYRMKPKLENQVMGNLPKPRVTLIRAFRSVGMDFSGPFAIRVDLASRTKTQKAYVFVSRRNLPAEIYSDNGRNFVGADRELRRLFEQEENQRKLIAATSDLNIQWRFQSPSAPHHGGLYEAAVKSTKYHLKRVAGDAVFNFEEFNTLLSQVEATLNSRPLTQLSDNPTDPQPLTPGHFLTMAPLNQLPDPDVTHLKISTLNRWQLCQKVYQDFVKRWKRDYLHTLQQRLKWTETKKNLKEGDIVLLSEESLGDPKWTMGRVVDVYRGNDGCVRTVKVLTIRGEFLRSITKLAKYPTEEIWGSSTPIFAGEC
ncbi:uncharacterized protein LOC129808498 [Phlebotomus papatasi]|uniref:uncharacterized protein LOC129808498 n=1 Tax=Phlebotomus papatasi TaxID=29031 RepID=UPI0024838C06|nr:uncharacterized protein LOC129808498 [Phlebotomus papatasi]